MLQNDYTIINYRLHLSKIIVIQCILSFYADYKSITYGFCQYPFSELHFAKLINR